MTLGPAFQPDAFQEDAFGLGWTVYVTSATQITDAEMVGTRILAATTGATNGSAQRETTRLVEVK